MGGTNAAWSSLAIIAVACWQSGLLDSWAGRVATQPVIAEARAYTDEQVRNMSSHIAAIETRVAGVENTLREAVTEQRLMNRQIGELVGELRARRLQ